MKVCPVNSMRKAAFHGFLKILSWKKSDLNKSSDMLVLTRELIRRFNGLSKCRISSFSLTNEDFELSLSVSPDNDNLQALVLEYFTGNFKIMDCESSDNEDGIQNVLLRNLLHHIGEASTFAKPSLDYDYYDYSEGNNIECNTSTSKKCAEIKTTNIQHIISKSFLHRPV